LWVRAPRMRMVSIAIGEGIRLGGAGEAGRRGIRQPTEPLIWGQIRELPPCRSVVSGAETVALQVGSGPAACGRAPRDCGAMNAKRPARHVIPRSTGSESLVVGRPADSARRHRLRPGTWRRYRHGLARRVHVRCGWTASAILLVSSTGPSRSANEQSSCGRLSVLPRCNRTATRARDCDPRRPAPVMRRCRATPARAADCVRRTCRSSTGSRDTAA
jgi:hypothetical protein